MQLLSEREADPLDSARGHATRQATERLRELILDGGLAPGSRISERMVQERYGISRTPLREALKILSVEGLVAIYPNRGAVVALLSLEELQAAFELLAALDGAAGELAADRASDATIAEIAALHDEMVRHYEARQLQDYFRVNKAIHLAIVDAAANPAISRVYRSESARVDRYRYRGNRDPGVWARSIRQHEQILDALRMRHGALLRETLVSHRRSGFDLARRVLDEDLAHMPNQAVVPVNEPAPGAGRD
ncbi:MAG TPA: GntR family transcriptional regulator [Hyphomicrobiaceae bacterium]|nr:GntR family transcriptional regulator [Hyphomicrobiaceae bacterium]